MKILPKAKRMPNGTISEPRSVRLTSDEIVEAKHYATSEEQSLTWFLRILVLRGLDDYKRALSAHQ